MERVVLTVRRLDALKPRAARYEVMDEIVRHLGIRVTEKGTKSFFLLARYPGANAGSSARREIGRYGVMSLDAARTRAREWLDLIQQGIDPADVQKRAAAAEQVRKDRTFSAVASDFFQQKLPEERAGAKVKQYIVKEFLPDWENKPIDEITDLDILKIINAKKRTGPVHARNLLTIVKRFFSWVIDQRVYGLKASPAEGLKPAKIIGERVVRDRTLSNDELFALWRAAGRLPYPVGPAYRLLMLTALRLNEAAKASWQEFDLREGLWVIPAARMKKVKGRARAHAVPITAEIRDLVDDLPRFDGGTFLFSTTGGRKAVSMSDKVKKRLDALMLDALRELAAQRGDAADGVVLQPWTNHDIRRTVRTNLSKLRIPEDAREAVLAHAMPGIRGTYDHHDYLDEKREALEAWAARLRSIVEPAPGNVVALRRGTA